MNYKDINYLIQFGDLCLKYFAEDDEYSLDGWSTHLENAQKLRKRIEKIIPVVSTIIEHYSLSKNKKNEKK